MLVKKLSVGRHNGMVSRQSQVPCFPTVFFPLKTYSPLHASLIFLALAWVLPFLQWQHKPPIPSFYSEWLAFGLGLLALLPLLGKRYWQPLVLPRSLLFVLSFIAILVIQVALDRVLYPQQALVGALYILWAAFLLWLGNRLGKELGLERIANVLAWALLLGALLSCGLALLQHFGLHTPLDAWVNRKVSGAVLANLGQPNHLANYLVLGLASLLYLVVSAKLRPWLGLPLALLLVLVLALTGSRASWLYLGALLVLAGLWRRQAGASTTARWLFPMAMLLLPIFAAAQWLAHLPFMQGVSGVVTPTERLFDLANGVDVRLALWREALQMLTAHPWLGVGFGQFAWHNFQMASAGPTLLVGSVFNHSHNILAQIAAEFGITGLLLFLMGGGLWLWGCLRRPATLPGWWAAALLAVLGIHSLLEYPLWYANFLGIAAILIGATDAGTLRLRLSGLLQVAFGLMLLLSALAGLRMLNAYRQLEGLLLPHQVKMSPQEMDRVLQQVRQESLLAPYSDFAYALSIAPNRELITDKIALNAQVMHFAPTQELVYRHALLLGVQGDSAAAQAMLKRALYVYPAGAGNFLQTWAGLDPESREQSEPLATTARVFLQERKQDAIRTK